MECDAHPVAAPRIAVAPYLGEKRLEDLIAHEAGPALIRRIDVVVEITVPAIEVAELGDLYDEIGNAGAALDVG